jgi:hypothetical protein
MRLPGREVPLDDQPDPRTDKRQPDRKLRDADAEPERREDHEHEAQKCHQADGNVQFARSIGHDSRLLEQ